MRLDCGMEIIAPERQVYGKHILNDLFYYLQTAEGIYTVRTMRARKLFATGVAPHVLALTELSACSAFAT